MKVGHVTMLTGWVIAASLGCQAWQPPPTNRLSVAASFRGDVVPVLREHCAGCHTLGRPGARSVAMFDAGGAALHLGMRPHFYHMLETIDTGQMPLGRPGTVSAAQKAMLRAWWESGMPDN